MDVAFCTRSISMNSSCLFLPKPVDIDSVLGVCNYTLNLHAQRKDENNETVKIAFYCVKAEHT